MAISFIHAEKACDTVRELPTLRMCDPSLDLSYICAFAVARELMTQGKAGLELFPQSV